MAEPICDHGCPTASACKGACQPPLLVSTGRRCKHCEMGERRVGAEHWIVQSIAPAKLEIRPCAAVREKAA